MQPPVAELVDRPQRERVEAVETSAPGPGGKTCRRRNPRPTRARFRRSRRARARPGSRPPPRRRGQPRRERPPPPRPRARHCQPEGTSAPRTSPQWRRRARPCSRRTPARDRRARAPVPPARPAGANTRPRPQGEGRGRARAPAGAARVRAAQAPRAMRAAASAERGAVRGRRPPRRWVDLLTDFASTGRFRRPRGRSPPGLRTTAQAPSRLQQAGDLDERRPEVVEGEDGVDVGRPLRRGASPGRRVIAQRFRCRSSRPAAAGAEQVEVRDARQVDPAGGREPVPLPETRVDLHELVAPSRGSRLNSTCETPVEVRARGRRRSPGSTTSCTQTASPTRHVPTTRRRLAELAAAEEPERLAVRGEVAPERVELSSPPGISSCTIGSYGSASAYARSSSAGVSQRNAWRRNRRLKPVGVGRLHEHRVAELAPPPRAPRPPSARVRRPRDVDPRRLGRARAARACSGCARGPPRSGTGRGSARRALARCARSRSAGSSWVGKIGAGASEGVAELREERDVALLVRARVGRDARARVARAEAERARRWSTANDGSARPPERADRGEPVHPADVDDDGRRHRLRCRVGTDPLPHRAHSVDCRSRATDRARSHAAAPRYVLPRRPGNTVPRSASAAIRSRRARSASSGP